MSESSPASWGQNLSLLLCQVVQLLTCRPAAPPGLMLHSSLYLTTSAPAFAMQALCSPDTHFLLDFLALYW